MSILQLVCHLTHWCAGSGGGAVQAEAATEPGRRGAAQAGERGRGGGEQHRLGREVDTLKYTEQGLDTLTTVNVTSQ